MKKLLLSLCILFIISIAFVAGYVKKQWCPKIQQGNIFLGSTELPESNVYDAGNGDIIVLLVKERNDEQGMFLISPQRNEVSWLSRSDFFKFPIGLYSRYYPYHSIIIEKNEIKTDFNPELKIDSKQINFKFRPNGESLTIKRF